MNYVCCCFRRVKKETPVLPIPTYSTFDVVQLVPPKPIIAGRSYEIRVRNAFRQRGIETLDQTAGATKANDVTIIVNGEHYGVEVKTKNAAEGGQRAFQFRDDRLVMDDSFFGSLINNHVPFEGRIPSFLRGDKTFETWIAEKCHFEGEYIPVGDDAVSRYYANKGSTYIYIQNMGLYHTGEDPGLFGIPEFRGKTRVRIRCKQHGKSSVPGSVMASLVFKHPAEKSPFILDV
jgi:hypothetical protein